MKKRIICAVLLCVVLSTSAFAAGSGVYGGEGAHTMFDIREKWEQEGYPQFVTYAERDGSGGLPQARGDYGIVEKTEHVVLDGELREEYGEAFTAERWEIGVAEGSEAELIALLEKELSNVCVVNVVPCQNSREHVVSVYGEVLKDFGRRPSFDSVKLEKDRVILRVSPLTRGVYAKLLAKKYGDTVSVLGPRGNHESFHQFDENGNIVGEGSSSFAFEIWLAASAVSLVVILLLFGLLFAVKKRRKKR